jgi:hypothetical protein
VPATTTKPQPELPPNAPRFAPQKHPLRFAITGKQHLIAPLKELISATPEIPDHYKTLIHAELDRIKTTAAQVDLHVVDHADGGISIQGHIKPIHLG